MSRNWEPDPESYRLGPSIHDVSRRQGRVCRDCSRTGLEVPFTVHLLPWRCDECLNTPHHRARLYRYEGSSGRHRPQVADLTVGDWLDLLVEHDYRCVYCKTPASECVLVRDHVISIRRRGQHTKSNILPACRPCNSSKRDLPPTGIWQPPNA